MSFFTTPLIILFLFFILISTIFIVKQQSAAIVERFGKFQSVRGPGLQVKIPLVDRVVDSKVFDAFYKLDFPQDQITSYVFDLIRSQVPKMKLDDVFSKQDDIAVAVKQSLGEAMDEYGYFIVKALVTDIEPDAEVKIAMNRINAADREKTAAQYEGDAARILMVEKAKAEAESKRLQGQGIADQRREIAKGIEDSVGTLGSVGINSQEASALIVVTQHYDTLQSIGGETNSNLILMPNSPQAGSTMLNDMVAAFTASSKIGEAMQKENQKNSSSSPKRVPSNKPEAPQTPEFGEFENE